ncbi:ABC transporter permease [Levilactobacillus parabrevis]|uniref:ABC transporter permease n=1 Tax=Levilactobacillus parabrevis TaxID=357278 RepID=UPI0021A44F3C|nr:ABC transporter permease [Levilactobacillus parabrevis]MCT4487895.1 ABC transporter permease [Levilactobacillus parabrevis]MCT4491239.1 ABC transporter permease [Levilactobacillus parabrevis]
MLAMIKRNLLLYFRNWSGVFFSLMGALISFVLYLIFLKQNMLNSWDQVPHAARLLDLWLIGGTLAITGITTTLTSLSQIVIDREKHVTADLQLTDAGPLRLQLSYLLSAVVIGVLMQAAMFAIMLGDFALTDHVTVTIPQTINALGLMVVSALLATAVNAILIQGVRTVTNLSKLGSIIGTAAGFLVGTYIPIGLLPTIAQDLVKLTPGSYVAALYRQLLMDDRLNTVFRQAPVARMNFEKLMGIRLSWSGLLTQSATYHIIGLIFIGALILTVGPTWVKQYHQRRRLRER